MRNVLLVCMLGASLTGCTSKKEPESGAKAEDSPKVDHEAEGRRAALGLLREYVDAFKAVATSANASAGREFLVDLRKKAVSTHHLPEEFERRYFTMLDAWIAMLAPKTGKGADPKRREKIEAFVKSAGGPDAKFDPDGGIAGVAKLFVQEVVALHLLLDPSASPDDVHEKYFPQR